MRFVLILVICMIGSIGYSQSLFFLDGYVKDSTVIGKIDTDNCTSEVLYTIKGISTNALAAIDDKHVVVAGLFGKLYLVDLENMTHSLFFDVFYLPPRYIVGATFNKKENTLYMSGSYLSSYNLTTDTYVDHGFFPNSIVLIDIVFYGSRLIGNGTDGMGGQGFYEVDPNNPSNLTIVDDEFSGCGIGGLAITYDDCSEFKLWTTGYQDSLFYYDGISCKIGCVPDQHIQDLASSSEGLGGYCDIIIDLDLDDSSLLTPYDVQDERYCEIDSVFRDSSDIMVYCGYGLMDSVVVTLDNYQNKINMNMSYAGTVIEVKVIDENTIHILNKNSAIFDDFEEAMRSIRLSVVGDLSLPVIVEISFVAYHEDLVSEKAVAYIGFLEEDGDAGVDSLVVFCEETGDIDLLEINMASSLDGMWNGGTHSGVFDMTIDSSGIYEYIVNRAACKSDTSYTTVEKKMIPFFDLGEDIYLCEEVDTIIGIASDSGISYEWNTTENSSMIEIDSEGSYVLTGSNECGEFVDTMEVFLDTTPEIDLMENDTICEGESLAIGVVDSGWDYIWSTDEESSEITVSQSGIYSLAATNDCGTAVDSIVVVEIGLPYVSMVSDTSYCTGESIDLFPWSSYGNYVWSTGDTTESILVSEEGIYELTVINLCGEESTSVLVTEHGVPSIDLGDKQYLCQGDEYEVNLSGDYQYVWEDGDTSSTVVFQHEGLYHVIAYYECGQVSDSLEIVFIPSPSYSIDPEEELCEGDTLLIGDLSINDSILWNTGSIFSQIEVYEAGFYSFEIVTECGVFEDYIEVIVCPRKDTKIYIPNIFTPNEDGINDVFKPYIEEQHSGLIIELFTVYDRWGNKVHEEKGLTFDELEGWHGDYRGDVISQGVYSYVVQIQGESLLVGTVTITR